MNTSGNGSDSLKELKDYVFMTYFRKKKTKHLVEMLFSGYQLFVPITVSLPLTLRRKDIYNHIAKPQDEIHYETLSGKHFTMIESEIRTGSGFKEGRVLSFLRKYFLKVDEIKQVFDLDSIPSTTSTNYELVIYVISSPLERGLVTPPADELLSYDQLCKFMSYLDLYYYIQPNLLYVVQNLSITPEPPSRHSSNSLYSIRDMANSNYKIEFYETPGSYKQLLKEEGRKYFSIIHQLTLDITRKNKCLLERKNVVHLALHQCLLRLISKQVTMSALQNLSMEIREFDIARERLAAISLADLHVLPLFQCNFMPALAEFNCSYFNFNYHPETCLPLTLLQCWHELLVDIRYCIQQEMRRKCRTKEEMNSTLSTDDLISIVIYLLVNSNLASSIPAHFIIVDAFAPCELACSVLGYTYGIMETAVAWILKNGKKK